jgi:hypothetical protein
MDFEGSLDPLFLTNIIRTIGKVRAYESEGEDVVTKLFGLKGKGGKWVQKPLYRLYTEGVGDTFFNRLAGLLPLYGDIVYYQKLMKANEWLREILPNWRAAAEPIRRFQSKVSQAFWSLSFLRSLEKISQKLHWRVMSPLIKNLANKNQQVIISDHILKLHTVDRREYFKHEYQLRLQKIGINV